MVIISSIGNEAEGNGENYPWYALQEEEEEEEKWHKYYSSSHRILLVGDGDFSFSLCLAKSFGSASNIVATSLDSYAALIRKYKGAKKNVTRLKKLGATVVHKVDATKMKLHPDIGMKKFDRIVYNFPHAGFKGKEDDLRLISKHRSLVYGFFHNARSMLRPEGEIHVNHKTTAPFSFWNLPQLASWNSLISLKPVDFIVEDFPGYSNKRGDGARSDEKFPLGDCSTFIFVLPYKIHKACNLYPAPGGLQNIPFPCQSHSLINDHYESNPIHDSFGNSRLFHSDGIVRPPPHSFDFVPFERERETYSVMSPTHPLRIVGPPLFHSPGTVRTPLSHSPRIVSHTPRSFEIVPFEREMYSVMSPTPSHGMVSSMLEDNTGIPRRVSMLSERCRSFDGHLNHVDKTFGTAESVASYPFHEAVRLGFERYTTEDPRRSAGGYPYFRAESVASYPFHEAARLGFERYTTEDPRRSASGYPHFRAESVASYPFHEAASLGFGRYTTEDPRRSASGYPHFRAESVASYPVHEAARLGFEGYTTEDPRRSALGYPH